MEDDKLNLENVSQPEEGSVIFTPKIEEEGKIDELPEKSYEEIQAEVDALVKDQEGEENELTDEEKKAQYIELLKESRKVFRPLSNPMQTVGTHTEEGLLGRKRQVKDKAYATNVTVNQFDSAYKQKRKRKNNQKKTSRKANR